MIKDFLKPLVSQGRRNRIARARVALRRPTGPFRQLPDFLVLGAMRAGTSSLFRYLGAHPAVAPSLRKETEYFSLWYGRGESWYRAHFPLQSTSGVGPQQCFEATPYYLAHPHAPPRARAALPEAKLVVMLRDPVARAISHHRHLVRLGIEPLPFQEAIEREPDRLAGEWDRLVADPSYRSRNHHLFSYLARGRYAEQLERWFEQFPRDRFLILEHETFFRDPHAGFAELLRFLELPPWHPAEFRNYSHSDLGEARRTYGRRSLAPSTKTALRKHFEPHDRRLGRLLGKPPAWTDR